MSLGSAKSSSGSTPSESSGSSMAEESSIFSSMEESSILSSMEESAASSAMDESSSAGGPPYNESSADSSAVSAESDSAGSSGDSAGSSGYCSFDVYDFNVPSSNVGVFSVYNSGTVDLTLQLLTIFVEYWDYEPYFPLVLAPGAATVVTVTLPSDTTIAGAYAALDTSCGAATWNFPT